MRARDVFQNLVDEDDGNGEPKHRAPLFVVERGDGERLREGWDVHDDEMEPHADDDGDEQPDIRRRRVGE